MKALEPITFNRAFQLWEYKVSHGQLLLRSVKAPLANSRVDILFKNVGFISLSASLKQITIRETSPLAVGLLGNEDFLRGRKVYRVESEGYVGCVAAGIVVYHEDQGEYDDPSLLLT